MADIITVQIKLDARAANAQLKQFQRGINTAGGANQQIIKTNKSIQRGVNLLRLYASAWIAANAAMAAIREIQTVQNMNRAISTVIPNIEHLEDTWNRLRDISLETRSDFEANVTLFQRLSFATEDLGLKSGQLEQVITAVGAGLKLGGTTGQEAASSIRQLSQAFSKGKLDGDEFRSLMENAGFLMNEFRKELGISREELLQMSRQGKLTSEVLVDGLLRVADTVRDKLEGMPKNISDAFEILQTQWQNFVNTLEKSGVFDLIVKGILKLGEAFSWLSTKIMEARNLMEAFGVIETEDATKLLEKQSRLATRVGDTYRQLQRAQQNFEEAPASFLDPRLMGEETLAKFEKRNDLQDKHAKLLKELEGLNVRVANSQNKLFEASEEEARVLADREFLERMRKREILVRKEAEAVKLRNDSYEEGVKHTVAGIEAEARQMEQAKKAREEQEKFIMEQIGIGTEPDTVIEQRKNQLQLFSEQMMTTQDVFINAMKGMEDALVEFVMTGKLDFSSLIDSIIADIARLAIQQTITRPLAESLSGIFGPTTPTETSPIPQSGAGGFLGSAFNALRGFLPGFQSGGAFTVGGKSGIDKNLVAFRASKGEQVTITPKGQAGGVNVVMNIQTQDAESFGRNQDQMMNALQARLSVAQRNL